jgi:transaldolase / glucose-6-phosphate isomerase
LKGSATMNPLTALHNYRQSVWLDYIRRSLITSGELKRLLDEDGLSGITSNPSILEKAIVGSSDYQDLMLDPKSSGLDAKGLYERIAVRDIQDAADILRPVYLESQRLDGYVSMEIAPDLARDTQGTLQEARRLWEEVNRENLMIKIPGTVQGVPAVEVLISEGININVTLLFAVGAYENVAAAYLHGLTSLLRSGGDVSKVASVASFFISRIDTFVDSLLTERLRTSENPAERVALRAIAGKVGIANAKLAYQKYLEIYRGQQWEELSAEGATPQRLLWASTGTKNPSYRDVVYVEELIGPDTVDTIPPATFDAFRDHGQLRLSLTEDLESAFDTIDSLRLAGISLDEVAERLLAEGLRQFEESFAKLLKATDRRERGPNRPKIAAQTWKLPAALMQAVGASLEDWRTRDKVHRLWARDATLWTGKDEGHWLDWLGITEDRAAHLEDLHRISLAVKSAGYRDVLLMGMGGSSLCPRVLRQAFGHIAGYPQLHVLDSTDPAQVVAFEKRVDLRNALFVVASKSGSTLEPNIFKQYFFSRVREALGSRQAGERFVAITDPGSKLQLIAEQDGFRHIFPGVPGIGGRYSALSNFGMVPAAIMGVNVNTLLDRAEAMVHACKPSVPIAENPGVMLGTLLGVAHNQGRDKLTLITSPGIRDLGAWLEQLIAESTGKNGKGLVVVNGESPGDPAVYGQDRLFCYLRLESAPDAAQDAAADNLERAGHPMVRVAVPDAYDVAAEFFRWEFATAVAGSIMGIDPFDQPDVEASKLATRKLTSQYERTGELPPETAVYAEDDVKVFADQKNAAALKRAVGNKRSLSAWVGAHLDRLAPGDYFALLAYLEVNEPHEQALQSLGQAVRDVKHVATCVGFGGYKGGSNKGVFLQITCADARDLPIPGQELTFSIVKAAQARGDFMVLAGRQRRALRIHLGRDVSQGLAKLQEAFRKVLAGKSA